MPVRCPECSLDLPDGVNVQGLRQVEYCPFCGTEVQDD